jgi:hypothetical protein
MAVVGEVGSEDAGREAESAAGIARHFGAEIVLVCPRTRR